MNPYFNNTPFITGMSNNSGSKGSDNGFLFLIGGIVVIGGVICLYHYQQNKNKKIIADLSEENNRLKRLRNA